jgi:SAM-dependent methyltransferase
MDNTERFSNRVGNYVKYRPGYPTEILHYLEEETGFGPDWIVADVGSGTGISTALFLDKGNTVYGVEPNQSMRESAEELLGSYERFISVNGTAENTGLKTGSVDLVVASQAFHWFEPVAASKEFSRILRDRNRPTIEAGPKLPNSGPGQPAATGADQRHDETRGFVALIWNERQINTPFEQAYESFLLTYAIDYTTVNHTNISAEKIGAFFDPQPFRLRITGNQQVFDWNGLKGRVLSSSYMPDEQNARYEEMIGKLKAVFEKYQVDGTVQVNYLTKLYVGK